MQVRRGTAHLGRSGVEGRDNGGELVGNWWAIGGGSAACGGEHTLCHGNGAVSVTVDGWVLLDDWMSGWHLAVATGGHNPQGQSMLRFNQDRTCVAVTGETGSQPPAIYHCNPFGLSWKGNLPVRLLEQLFSTSLVAIVPIEDPTLVHIINTKKNKVICELPFAEHVQDVRMNRKRLIVLLQKSLQIYDVASMKLLKQVETTGKICDLSIGDESILVYQREDPVLTDENEIRSNRAGDVIVYDTINLKPVSLISCHIAPVNNLVLNNNGNILASTSTKGTLIRIFDTRSGIRLCEFRRGSLPTTISSLVFDLDCLNVACTSLSGSVHIFQLPESVTELSSISSSVSELPLKSLAPNTTDLPQTEPITDAESDELHRILSNVTQSSFTNKLWKTSKHYINLPKSATPTLKQPHIIIRLPFNGIPCEITFNTNSFWAATQTALYEYTFFPNGSRQPNLQNTYSLTIS